MNPNQIVQNPSMRSVTACFTGHRPNKLGGYDWNNPVMIRLKDRLFSVIATLILRHGVQRFISGGALGTDQAAFWCVQAVKEKYPHIQNIVAVPFKSQASQWPLESRQRYQQMLEKADQVIYVDELPNYVDYSVPTGRYSKYKMQNRNRFMVDQSKFIVAVFDGSKGGTYNCLQYAKQTYQDQVIYRLDPLNNFAVSLIEQSNQW